MAASVAATSSSTSLVWRSLPARHRLLALAPASFVIFNGAMIDTQTQVNLTEKRVDEMINHKFSDFPLKDAIKVVRGNGSRVVVTFEDPNCATAKS